MNGYIETSFRADDKDQILVKDSVGGRNVVLHAPRLWVPVTREAITEACAKYSVSVTDIAGTVHEIPAGPLSCAVAKYRHAAEAVIGLARSKKGKTGIIAGASADQVLRELAAFRSFGGKERTGRRAPDGAALQADAQAAGIKLDAKLLAFLQSRGVVS